MDLVACRREVVTKAEELSSRALDLPSASQGWNERLATELSSRLSRPAVGPKRSEVEGPAVSFPRQEASLLIKVQIAICFVMAWQPAFVRSDSSPIFSTNYIAKSSSLPLIWTASDSCPYRDRKDTSVGPNGLAVYIPFVLPFPRKNVDYFRR